MQASALSELRFAKEGLDFRRRDLEEARKRLRATQRRLAAACEARERLSRPIALSSFLREARPFGPSVLGFRQSSGPSVGAPCGKRSSVFANRRISEAKAESSWVKAWLLNRLSQTFIVGAILRCCVCDCEVLLQQQASVRGRKMSLLLLLLLLAASRPEAESLDHERLTASAFETS